jgi:prepilin-type N-terminal cleavage/methylation domain-containing protein
MTDACLLASTSPATPIARGPACRHPVRGARAGVTLIELLMVVVVMGIITAIAVPRLNTATFDVDAGARGLVATFQRAQRQAMQRQVAVNVAVDTAARRLRIVEDSNANGVFEDVDRVTWHPLAEKVYFTAAPPAPLAGAPSGQGPVRGSNLRDMLGLPSTTYIRSGAASGDLVLYIEGRARGRVERRAVTVAQSTGRADVFRWTNGAWRRGGG